MADRIQEKIDKSKIWSIRKLNEEDLKKIKSFFTFQKKGESKNTIDVFYRYDKEKQLMIMLRLDKVFLRMKRPQGYLVLRRRLLKVDSNYVLRLEYYKADYVKSEEIFDLNLREKENEQFGENF